MEQATHREFLFANATRQIHAATSGLMRGGDEAVRRACEELKDELDYDLVSIQLTEPVQQIVQTVYGSGLKGEWYSLASHSLEVPEEFRDIQAFVATHEPPIIEIVEGDHPRFDRFIYKTYGHEHYARAFVPLMLRRGRQGQLGRANSDDFEFRSSGAGSRRVVRLLDSLASQSHVIIGTVEAGFDNASRVDPTHISDEAVHKLFASSCKQAFKLLPSTLWNVLQVIVENARCLTGSESAIIRLPEDASFPYQVWSGLDPSAYERLPDFGRMKFPISLAPRSNEFLEQDSGMLTVGSIFFGFRQKPDVTFEDDVQLDVFFAYIIDAVQHATWFVQSLHLARQLGNLHDIAMALAQTPEHPDLLETIAGHAANVLTADLVAIYQFHEGEFRDGRAIVGTRSSSALPNWKPSVDLVQQLQGGETVEYADTQEKLEELYGAGTSAESVMQFLQLEKIQTAAIALLRVSSDVVGVMLINFRRKRMFSRVDGKTIETVASTAALALRTKQLLNQREEDVQTLVHDMTATMEGMVKTATDLKKSADFLAAQSDVLHTISKTVRCVLGEDSAGGATLIDEQPTDLNISEIADRVWTVARANHGWRGVKLSSLESREAVQQVHWNRSALVYALYALLDNAGKYADERSTVHVAWSQCSSEQVRISITITGLPITRDEAERIFEKFTRGDGARKVGNKKGVGLGLFIASKFLNMHGGGLGLETNGRTSCFVLTIPSPSPKRARQTWCGNTF